MLSSRKKSKKAVSIMIGYVLLITFAIILGAVVYTWLRSYVPRETIECPDGVSVFIKDIKCESIGGNEYNLTLNLTNNGRFSIDAYYLRVSENPEIEIGTKSLTEIVSGNVQAVSGGIITIPGQLQPGTDAGTVVFKTNKAYLAEITPIRYEVIEGKRRLAICGEAKVKETIDCE